VSIDAIADLVEFSVVINLTTYAKDDISYKSEQDPLQRKQKYMQLHDPAAAQRLLELAREHVASNHGHPGFRVSGDEVSFDLGGDTGENIILTRVFVRMSKPWLEAYLIDGPCTQSNLVTVHNDIVTLEADSPELAQAVIDDVAKRFTEHFVVERTNTVYGYVDESGIVPVIMFNRVIAGYFEGTLHAVGRQYLLDGHEVPAELLIVKGSKDWAARYTQQFWDLMAEGRIIEIADRISNSPGEVWVVDSDTDWPHVVFEKDDDVTPTIPADVQYKLRFLSDPADDLPRSRQAAANFRRCGAERFSLRKDLRFRANIRELFRT
jgi:hypothetical protein